MSLGLLPYQAKVTGMTKLPSGQTRFEVTVLDASSTIRTVTSVLYHGAAHPDSDGVCRLLDSLREIAIRQLLVDAGDLATAPCNPEAAFSMVKSDGQTERRNFRNGSAAGNRFMLAGVDRPEVAKEELARARLNPIRIS
jgi:hypothetical protein